MIRRLSSVSSDGETGFDGIARRSFGYFVRKAHDAASADAWLESRRSALVVAAATLQDPLVLDWQLKLAVRNGVPPEIIERLAAQFDAAPVDSGTTVDWIGWLLDVCVQSARDLTLFLRETSLESVFGRAYTNQNDKDTATKQIVDALKMLVAMWCSGKTIVDIEVWLLNFVREHEGQVTQQAARDAHAKRARRFAIRILPDIGFMCGLLAQISGEIELNTGKTPPPIIELLQQMAKLGDSDRHHYCLRQETFSSTRVGSFEDYTSLTDGFTADVQADLEVVRHEVKTSLAIRAFSSLVDE